MELTETKIVSETVTIMLPLQPTMRATVRMELTVTKTVIRQQDPARMSTRICMRPRAQGIREGTRPRARGVKRCTRPRARGVKEGTRIRARGTRVHTRPKARGVGVWSRTRAH